MRQVKHNWVWCLHTPPHEVSLELLRVNARTQNIWLNDAVTGLST